MKRKKIYILVLDGEYIEAFVTRSAALTHAKYYLDGTYESSGDQGARNGEVTCLFYGKEHHSVAVERIDLVYGANNFVRSVKDLEKYVEERKKNTTIREEP